jgi:surface antigen
MCLTVVPVSPPKSADVRPRPGPRRHLVRLCARLLVPLLAASALVAAPAGAPSVAASRYLCTGYTACANAGYSHAGYGNPSVNRKMYWRMYAGHNCTNYVAYRMIQAGYSTERPWSGSGNATNWGVAMSRITDQTPTVGSVAWWKAGKSGVGSSGHVAYVERVVSPTEIVISEDSWSGDFHWRTIQKGTSWPSGFIHFVDTKAVEATAQTRIEGVPQVGQPLRGFLGRFKPASAAHALQWLVDGVAVPGATTNTFTPRPEDAGKVVTLRDTGTLAGHTSAATTSAPTEPVATGTLARVAKPTVSGFAEVGQTVSVTPGQWTPVPTSTTYRWRLDGVHDPSLKGRSIALTDEMVGKTISVVEMARAKGYGQLWNASGNLGPVVAGVVELAEPFRASGAARHGQSLTFSPGTWSPTDAKASYEWFRDGVAVPEVTGSTYPLAAADVGRRITVKASVTRDRFRGLTRSADYGVVTTPGTMRLYAGGRKKGAVARVRISAPGAVATGTIWARIRDEVVRGTVVDGYAELKLTGLTKGRRTMTVLYAGNGVVDRIQRNVVVTVKK